MIARDACMAMILGLCPGFQDRWHAYLEYWDQEPPGVCLDLSEFARYIVDLVSEGRHEELPAIFALIEKLVVEGDDQVATAATTCCLENLINISGTDRLPPESFVPLLGPESRAYCQAWDEFTGVRTPGL